MGPLLDKVVVWFAVALLPACADACEKPRNRDAGPAAELGDFCESHWDCALGLVCERQHCDEPRSDPPPDAEPPDGRPDAQPDAAPDAGPADAAGVPSDAGHG
jgi:hypothetical protein